MTIPFIDVLAQRSHLVTEEKTKRAISLPR
jgi:hypothetical protein